MRVSALFCSDLANEKTRVLALATKSVRTIEISIMKFIYLFLASFTMWGLVALPSHGCELAESDSLTYSLQPDGSCEGIRIRIDVSGSLDLISLTSTTGGRLGNSLRIRVPRRGSNRPVFSMQELNSRYLLDSISFSIQSDFYSHSLSTQRLKRSGIDSVNDLRAIAAIGSQRVYLPTLLNTPADGYRFVFYSVDNVRFVNAGIRSAGQQYVTWGSQGTRRGEKAFEWGNANNAPAGRYEFYYVAEIEQRNRPPERISRSIAFWHDPSWLR